jgi:hypothetical protein
MPGWDALHLLAFSCGQQGFSLWRRKRTACRASPQRVPLSASRALSGARVPDRTQEPQDESPLRCTGWRPGAPEGDHRASLCYYRHSSLIRAFLLPGLERLGASPLDP